jgi:hypothetical protein
MNQPDFIALVQSQSVALLNAADLFSPRPEGQGVRVSETPLSEVER